jgi:hypothetical protein
MIPISGRKIKVPSSEELRGGFFLRKVRVRNEPILKTRHRRVDAKAAKRRKDKK